MRIYFFGFILCLFFNSSAQVSDTLLNEVVLYSTKISDYTAGAKKVILDSADIELYRNKNVAELISNMTSVYVKNYGSGMSSSLSFRGTGAEHTNVLWNNFSINGLSLGMADLSIIPLNSVSSVEIQHGSSGSSHGNSSIGGTVSVYSLQEKITNEKLELQLGVGSFSNYFSSAAISYGVKNISSRTAGSFLSNKNNFFYNNIYKAGQPKERQSNAEIVQGSFNQDLLISLNKNEIRGAVWYNASERNISPSLGASHLNAHQQDQNVRSFIGWKHFFYKASTDFRIGYFRDRIGYSNDLVNADLDIENLQVQNELNFKIVRRINVKSGIDAQYIWGKNSAYPKDVSEFRLSPVILMNFKTKKFFFHCNFRKQFVSGFDPPVTPSFGVEYNLLTKQKYLLALKGMLSQGYRVPTLNNRYWITGNIDLLPEKSNSVEVGAVLDIIGKKHTIQFELTGFSMMVDNWIQWIESTPDWRPVNIQQVFSRGIESSSLIKKRFGKIIFRSRMDLALIKSTVEKTYVHVSFPEGSSLVYVPPFKSALMMEISRADISFNARYGFSAYRYTLSDNSDYLPGFSLLSISIGKVFKVHQNQVNLIFNIDNILNTSYQTYKSQPMPGRTYQLSIKFNFNQHI